MASDFTALFLSQAIALILYNESLSEKAKRRGGCSKRIPKVARNYKEYFEVINGGLFTFKLPETFEERENWFNECFSESTLDKVMSRVLVKTKLKIDMQIRNSMAVSIY